MQTLAIDEHYGFEGLNFSSLGSSAASKIQEAPEI